MSEWLTTGQLIEKLNIGEEAVCQEFRSWLIKNTEEEGILWEDGSKFYISNEIIRKAKWRILPKPIQYVTFEEATSALKEKKCRYAKLFTDTGYIVFENYTTKPYDLSLKQLVEGKWQIIE